jgi:hypothetical protein
MNSKSDAGFQKREEAGIHGEEQGLCMGTLRGERKQKGRYNKPGFCGRLGAVGNRKISHVGDR